MRVEILFGSYTLLNIIAVFLIDHWLCRSSLRYKQSVAARVIVCFLYAALAFMPILAVLISDSLYQYLLLRYSYIWMGFLMYFGGLILIASVLELIIRLVSRAKAKRRELEDGPLTSEELEKKQLFSKRISALVLLLIFAGSIGINAYGMIHAKEIKTTHYDVRIDKKVKKVKKLRAAMISDLHLSYNSDVKYIRRLVDRINSEKPDVVFVCGDIFSSSYGSVRKPEEYIKALKGIKAKEGVYWVYGNHDVEEPLFCGFGMAAPEDAVRTDEMVRFLKKSGFTILDDECTAIAGVEVQLVGRADLFKPVDRAKKRMSANELMDDLDRDKPILVLEHEPGDYKALAENGADVAFSGHTHDGQVFPGNVFTRLMNDVVYGMVERNGMTVIVTSGAGCYGPPLRVLTNNEIVITDITFSK